MKFLTQLPWADSNPIIFVAEGDNEIGIYTSAVGYQIIVANNGGAAVECLLDELVPSMQAAIDRLGLFLKDEYENA